MVLSTNAIPTDVSMLRDPETHIVATESAHLTTLLEKL